METVNDNLLKLLSARLYDPNTQPPPEEVVLKIRGENIGSLGNFSIISGLPKAGKSTFINSIISSNFNMERVKFQTSLNTPHNRPYIGYFDTESAKYDFYKNINRIKQMANLYDKLPYNLQAFSTRKDSAETNRLLIEFYCQEMKPSVIFIDGLLDCVSNYNDEKESRFVIDYLKRITEEYNVFILGVVHTGKKDNHTLGHFGSMVDRYAQSVLEVIKDIENNVFRLCAKYCRSSLGFADVCIQWNGSEYVEAFGVPNKNESGADKGRRKH